MLKGLAVAIVIVLALVGTYCLKREVTNGIVGDATIHAKCGTLAVAIHFVDFRNRVLILELRCIFIPAAIFVLDRLGRVAAGGLAEDIAVIASATSIVGLGLLAENAELELHLVIEKPMVDFSASLERIEIRTLENTLSLRDVDVGNIVGLCVSTHGRDVMDMRDGHSGNFVLPIGVKTLVLIGIESCILAGVQHLKFLGNGRSADVAIVLHRIDVSTLGCLGGDEDYAVGAARTIDGSCRTVLQHVDALDILRGNSAEVSRDAIDEDERVGVGTTNGIGTTQAQLGAT